MADEKVNVVIKFDAKTRQLDAAIAKMALLNKYEKRFASGQRLERFASRGGDAASKMAQKWKKSFDLIDASVVATGKFLTKFLGAAIKGVIGQMALFGASMIAVHATFAAGQFVMKAYRGAMQLVAGGAAAATMAIAAFSAAMREQQAAMFAYRGKGAKEFGSGMNQTRMAMRNLQADASLATLGVESLNKAYGTMSKSMNVAQINASTSTIKALMDFGSAGQDPAKGLEQVAVVISALSDKKKNISDVITEAKKLGPEMETALKKANVKTKAEFEKLLMSGKLAEKGGVIGQFNEINNTLIGQLKSYFTQLRVEFADFGDQFLEPLKVAFGEIFDIIKRDLSRIEATIMQTVGTQGIIDGLVGAFEKTSNFMVRLMREYLPQAIGLFGRIREWMQEFKRDWNIVLDRLRPLIDGARVLYKALSPIWDAIKDGLNQIFNFNNQLLGNEAGFREFGTNVASIIRTISDGLANMRSIFETIAPFINDVLKGFGDVFRMVTQFLTGGAGKGFLMALAPLIAMQTVGSKMAGVTGRMSPVLGSFSKAVTIQAQTATIVAAGMQGQVGGYGGPAVRPTVPVSGGGTPGFSSGAGSSLSTSAATSARTQAISDAAFGYSKQFAVKADGKTPTAPAYGGFSSGAREPQAFVRDALGNEVPVSGYRDLKNVPLRGMRGFFRGGRQLYKSFNAESIAKAAQLESTIANANTLMRGPLGNLSLGRRMMEPITGGIGGILAGGYPTNEQYEMATGMDPTDKDARLQLRKDIARQRRSARLQLMSNRVNRFARGTGSIGRSFLSYLNGPVFDPDNERPDAGRGGFTDPGSQRREARQRMIDARDQGQTRIGSRIRYMRDVNRINRGVGTRFGRGFTRFGASAGGKFGASAGLGMLSQVAPEEMRGAMALGGMAAQFDPRLGIAVAGIGGAMSAKGAGKGALSGAAGGAMIGAYFGGVGAIVGAGIGALVGGLMGAANKAKAELKRAKEIGQEAMMNMFGGLASAASLTFSRNQAVLEAGGTFAKGTRGAFQNVAGQAAQRLRAVETFIDQQTGIDGNKNSGANISDEVAIQAVRRLFEASSKGQLPGYSLSQSKANEAAKSGDTARAFLRETAGRSGLENITNIKSTASYLAIMQTQTDARFKSLALTLGRTGPELDALASAVGIDLYDATIQYKDLVKALGGAMVMTSQQLKGAATDLFLGGANPFKTTREAGEAQQRIDQSTRGIADKLRSGKLSPAEQNMEVASYMEGAFNDILALAGGDPLKAFAIYSKSFGAGAQGGQFAQGAALGGLGDIFYGNEAFKASTTNIRSGLISKYSDQLTGLLANNELGIDKLKLKTVLENQTDAGFVQKLQSIAELGDLTGKDAATVEKMLREIGFDPAKIGFTKLIDQKTAQERDAIPNEIAEAIKAGKEIDSRLAKALEIFNGTTKDFFTGFDSAPEWWKNGLGWDDKAKKLVPNPSPADAGNPDTSTPRGGSIGDTTTSKLQQTMDRHAALNSQVPGNRSVTSAWRNHSLGSINSDHVTGRAYDLVGQNLGKYQTLVREGGGFAEFHGNFGKRHLHVVPGPGAFGDSSSPAGKVTSMSSSGPIVNNNYNIEINGTNMSPEAIADAVIARIDKRNRSYAERS